VRVAILGMGVVGRAQARLFCDHDVVTWDAAGKDPYPDAAIAGCDFAIIAVGTPAAPGGGADLSQVEAAFRRLPPELPVLIRSTVPPGTTRWLQDSRPQVPVCCSPEFLHERPGAAWQESADVPWMLLGGEPQAREFFHAHLVQVFPGTIHECSAAEAELAKYTANLYWATRVTFVNEMAGICKAFGADWENVRLAWLEDERVSPEYTSMAGFGPGFGGRCWPKDLSALRAAASDAGYKADFLGAIAESNVRFRVTGAAARA
jgi:UDPglucose 6-dehydrogenase